MGTYDAVGPTNQFLKISRTQLLSKTESSEKPGTESASAPTTNSVWIASRSITWARKEPSKPPSLADRPRLSGLSLPRFQGQSNLPIQTEIRIM